MNNAGIGHKVAVEEEELEDFRQAMELNVTAVWHLAKLCAPSMIAAGGGSIVNIASILGHVAAAPIKQAHYCASKGAVVNLTRELAAAVGAQGGAGQRVVPGLVRVGDDRRAWRATKDRSGSSRRCPRSRGWVTPTSSMPRCCCWPVPASTFITGQSLIVDGGWTAR